MLQGWFMWFIVFWSIFLCGSMAVGGYFMFRKFLKKLPKEDGKSEIDWQEYYIQQSLHLWTDEGKSLLQTLVNPVPELFRDVAKQKIAGKIGQLALENNVNKINLDLIIKGYILATPKRDHKFLIKTLQEQKIDITPYEQWF
ncbi:DUF2621 domain-containing protein [Bacillus sp. HMF5848]|uniref:DUF2621 domain-containing protein n=1 Tax=Bacillus sp. HMF5848 TaxID=2495421 RepID=UPI000F7B839D|nr:DUF2621 domain-containing protein [Bacillus sp. HMF5848]RSK27126.1 DUF2621 domain-containing protein [Bacillus sp. HMF5848]